MNKPITILYVDDEPTNLLLFNIHFQKKHKVITSLSGSEGLKILNEQPDINVVVTDMKMPVMNGIEFIKKAKVDFPNVHFYILTGFDLTDEIAEALESKLILKYFSKPFNVGIIEQTITEAFAVAEQ